MMRQEKSKNLFKNWGVKTSSEMFGPAKNYTVKAFQSLKMKRRSWYICSLCITVLILVFVFSISPSHLDIKLPEDEDLLNTPLLRGQPIGLFNLDESTHLKERIIDFMAESCDQFSFDVIFCHMVLVNDDPFQQNCFMFCKEKSFYANVKVSTTEDMDTLLCTESYANIQQEKKRRVNVVFTGERFISTNAEEEGLSKMEPFTIIPKKAKDVCMYQHAAEIVSGTWIHT